MTHRRRWWIVGVAVLVAVVASAHAVVAQTTTRVVYVTATDGNRAPVADLTAADLVVKEGGKEWPVLDMRVAATPLNIAVVLEESLTNDTRTKQALLLFVRRLQGKARIALFVVGRSARLIVPYTTDTQSLVAGVSGLTFTQMTFDENLAEGIADTARSVAQEEAGRPVVLAVAVERQQETAMPVNRVLNALRDSGAMLYVATLTGGGSISSNPSMAMDESALDQVLDQGTKRSGGRRQESLRAEGFAEVLTGFANELLHQYAVTYVLPEGVQRSDRLSVASKRRGVSVRAATHIPGR
jgi:hypothetical protein